MRLMGNVCSAPTEFRDGDCGHAGDKHISSVGKIQRSRELSSMVALFQPADLGVPLRVVESGAQRAFPDARVVKTLNTMNAYVMIEPSRVPGRHSAFLAGEDAAAKETVKGLLGEFGWTEESLIDLGGIRAARGTEMYLLLWLSLMGVLGTGDFNIQVVKA
jgi:predicted dinucleotide-binding enzyme